MADRRRFGRRIDGPEGRRGAKREKLDLSVSLYSVDQSRVVQIADISLSGCRLLGIGLPGVGHDVLLDIDATELFGRIVWKEGDQRGLEFEEPISEEALIDIKSRLSAIDQ